MRCSALEPARRQQADLAREARPVRCTRRCARSGRRATSKQVEPSSSTRAPVGAMPVAAGPANVPVAVQCTAARSPSAISSSTAKREVRERAPNSSAEVRAHALGPVGVGLADDVVDAVRRPGGRDRVEVVRARARRSRRLTVSRGVGGHARHVTVRRHAQAHPSARRSGVASGSSPASGACGCRCRGRACRTATPGRSRPATGSCSSTRGMHEPGSMRAPRARARPGRPARRGRAAARLHARARRPLRPGRAGRRARRLRAVDAPAATSTSPRRPTTPRRRSRGGSRSRARAACRRSRCGAGSGAAGARQRHGRAAAARPRPGPRRRGRDRPRRWDVLRDARPRALARRACTSPSGGC